tara:strand:- start:436 stop:816 length:381 start_codon:yes stop_codon:yes gene_type:complete
MSTVRTFRAKVKDELEWDYPGALVAVRQFSESSQTTGISSDGVKDYEYTDPSIEAIAYRANYWPSVQAQVDGLKSRPLIDIDNQEDPDLFIVDLLHAQSIQVINGALSPIDKMFRLIELDVTRRFA